MAACIASSSMILPTSCCLVFWALGPAFSNFLKSSSTVLWSSRRSVMASMGEPCPKWSSMMHLRQLLRRLLRLLLRLLHLLRSGRESLDEPLPNGRPLVPHDREVRRVADGPVA